MFTIEAVYVILIVFSALIVLIASLQTVDVPNYDVVQAMKVSHDAGENMTTEGPPGFELAAPINCPTEDEVGLAYYFVVVCLP